MKNLIVFLAAAIFSLTLCGCDISFKKRENALSHARLMNKITVGIKSDSKPFGFVDKNGVAQGFDVDVAKGIAKYVLGDENAVEFVYVTPQSRILDLNTGSIDMIIAIMSMNESRASVVRFSAPYYIAGQAILVKKDSKIAALNDLNGKNVGFVLGTTGEKTIRHLAPGANLRAAKTYPAIFNLLKNGEIEAILADDSVLYGLVADNPGYKILPKRYTREYYSVALRLDEDSDELLDEVNAAINSMQQRGELGAIKDKWIPLLHY